MAVLVMCVGIILIGSLTYLSMPRENFPDVKVPVINVTTVLDGANPSDVEISVTVPSFPAALMIDSTYSW